MRLFSLVKKGDKFVLKLIDFLMAALGIFAISAFAEEPKIENLPGLPRAVRLSDRVATGYEPVGKTGFETLAKMGVKTIVSADGATPNLAEARALGIRYVHIP